MALPWLDSKVVEMIIHCHELPPANIAIYSFVGHIIERVRMWLMAHRHRRFEADS